VIESEKEAAASFLGVSPGLRLVLLDELPDEIERDPWSDGSTIAVYIADLSEQEPESAELRALLDHIEDLLTSATRSWMKDWVKVSILESIQNLVSNRRLAGRRLQKAGDIYDKLGERSREAWRELNTWWGSNVDDL
jgi:hypothetical protein